MRTRRRGALGLVAAFGLSALLAGCQSGSGTASVDLAHIHGLGVNPADGRLYAASHHGVFLVTGERDPQQIAGRTQDFMGFTVVGPDQFLGSGHPGPGDDEQPANLGLIESTDAGQSWTTLSLSGETDFHALDAKHGRIYGYDSQSGRVMVSPDKRTWDRRAQGRLVDLAVSPDNPDLLLATTPQGPARSTDGGRSFAAIPDAPPLAWIDWPSAAVLVGVAADGTVRVSGDGGDSWDRRGTVSGTPEAVMVHGDAEVYLATEDAIYRSTDQARSFTVFQTL